jgi:signal peptidase I
MQAVRAVARICATTILALLAALSVATATNWLHVTPVLSGSMRPTFNPGDALLTQRVPVTSLHVGDVIEFTVPAKYGGGLKVHRIVQIKRVGSSAVVHTFGDANGAQDPWQEALSGKAYRMRAVLPYVGWIVDFKAVNGFLWLMAAVLVLGLVSLAQQMVGRQRRHRLEVLTTAS